MTNENYLFLQSINEMFHYSRFDIVRKHLTKATAWRQSIEQKCWQLSITPRKSSTVQNILVLIIICPQDFAHSGFKIMRAVNTSRVKIRGMCCSQLRATDTKEKQRYLSYHFIQYTTKTTCTKEKEYGTLAQEQNSSNASNLFSIVTVTLS